MGSWTAYFRLLELGRLELEQLELRVLLKHGLRVIDWYHRHRARVLDVQAVAILFRQHLGQHPFASIDREPVSIGEGWIILSSRIREVDKLFRDRLGPPVARTRVFRVKLLVLAVPKPDH